MTFLKLIVLAPRFSTSTDSRFHNVPDESSGAKSISETIAGYSNRQPFVIRFSSANCKGIAVNWFAFYSLKTKAFKGRWKFRCFFWYLWKSLSAFPIKGDYKFARFLLNGGNLYAAEIIPFNFDRHFIQLRVVGVRAATAFVKRRKSGEANRQENFF